MEKNPTWTCVVAAALNDGEGHWLMQKRPEGKHHAGLWEFPGGKVESGENPQEALIRELEEELGIQVDPASLTPAGFAQEQPGSRSAPIVILLYTTTCWSGTPQALEGGELGWFRPDQMLELDRPALDIHLCDSLLKVCST